MPPLEPRVNQHRLRGELEAGSAKMANAKAGVATVGVATAASAKAASTESTEADPITTEADDPRLEQYLELVLTHRDYEGDDYTPQAQRLFQIWRQHQAFLGEAKVDARAVGEEINAAGGFESMRLVCETMRAVLGGVAARHLERAWSGVGRWQG